MSDLPPNVRLELLGKQMQQLQVEVRSIKRQMAILQASQSHLPTLDQFQAGLDAIDARITELMGEMQTPLADLQASQARMEVMLTDIARKLDA
jgi:hypothetical protein